ncbi:EAL domain-containing protein [Neptuniibacter sp. QD48_55]|uniref:EAL domain-containing protein n=1 Tax=Neptuniibacter sp. QD48_55 TaxID=3398212 RepID=UPI0039F596B5
MNDGIFIPLINNVALLLAMGALYDIFSFEHKRLSVLKKVISGILIGVIGIAIMSMPLSIVSGVLIDARSILLSVTGLFFGFIPTVIAVAITVAFRLFEGGQGIFAGFLIIVSSSGLGLLCHYWRVNLNESRAVAWWQLYLLGVVVHIMMLFSLLVLPFSTVDLLLSELALPIMLMFPIVTVLLGILLTHQIERRKAELALKQSEYESDLSRQKLEAIFAAIPDLLFEMDSQGRYYACHSAKKDELIVPESELIGKTVFDVMPFEAANTVVKALSVAEKEGLSRGYQIRLPLAQGEREFELSVSLKEGSDHVLPHFIVLSRDVTERKRAEKELHIAATAFDSQEGMLITDANHAILRVNSAFTRVTGYEPDEVIGKNPAILQSGQHGKSFYNEMMTRLQDEKYWQGEVWNKRKSGEIYPQYLTITAVQGDGGEITNYVGAFTDITQRKKDEANIHKLAFYDVLTGLPNRRSLQERLSCAIQSCHLTDQFGAVLFIDLDNFKNLNDTQGHDQGDLLLIEVANRLNNCVRNADMVARLGGDEFIIVLENLGIEESIALAQVSEIVDKLIVAIQQQVSLDSIQYHTACSVGITLFDSDDVVDSVMKRSDMAMYQAKESGKNTYRFYDPEAEKTLCSMAALESDLRKALSEQQLELHYQAQYHKDELIGAEALVRWHHPERGLVSPAEFIPLAEDTGLIVPIGDWILSQACKQLKKWQTDPNLPTLSLAVNVSARQFMQEHFVAEVADCIHRYGIQPDLLKLELTESLVLQDIEDTVDKMHQLRNLGIRFSLDDFGTGYSSLLHLKRLPLDQIKIDRSFIRDVIQDKDDAEIVQAIIAMGHNLGLNVIAEGVETEAQCMFLAEHNCTDYQGYFFGKPLPVDEFETASSKKPLAS